MNERRERLLALDGLRGAAVALMVLVNNPGSWHALYPPLAHAGWHGCTPTDLVFPLFLFAVGHALALVLPRWRAAGGAAYARHVALRTAAIFAIGLLLNAAPFVRWDADGALVLRSWETLRTMGVLQRIALCWGAAAAIVWWLPRRGVAAAAAALLLGYWLACERLGDPADPYALFGWFGTAVDRALLGAGHLYRGEGIAFDPEGLASTPPALAQVLIGWCVGEAVRRSGSPGIALVARLLLAATAMLAAAYVWQLAMPVNKKIWTSSYVLLTSGIATALLAVLVHVLDVRRRVAEQRGWVAFLDVYGRHALAVFVVSGLVPRVLALARWRRGDGGWTSPLPWLYETVFAPFGSADPRFGSLLYALAHVAAYWALARALDRRRGIIRA